MNNGEVNTFVFDTKILMVGSAAFLGLMGITATFFSGELLTQFDLRVNSISVMMLKITGALYLGFAVVNWMGRGNLIGGIYSRPVALGNFMHFVLVAATLIKFLVVSDAATLFIIGSIIYTLIGAGFGYILFSGGKACA